MSWVAGSAAAAREEGFGANPAARGARRSGGRENRRTGRAYPRAFPARSSGASVAEASITHTGDVCTAAILIAELGFFDGILGRQRDTEVIRTDRTCSCHPEPERSEGEGPAHLLVSPRARTQ